MPYTVLSADTAQVISAPSPDPAAPRTSVGITLGAATAEIIAMLDGRQDLTTERAAFWLNRAYKDLASSSQIDELKASLSFMTVADQPVYLLPATVVTTLTLSRVDTSNHFGGVPLDKIDITAYRTRNVETHKPIEYFRQGPLLVLYPTPDAAYSMVLDYRFTPSDLVDPTDSPMLREEWHEAWVVLGRKKLLSAVSEWEASAVIGNDFASHMRMRLDNESNEDENRVVMSSVPRTRAELLRKQRPMINLADRS